MPEHVHCTEASFGRVEVVFVYSTLGWVFVRGAIVQVCVLYWGLCLGAGCVLALRSLSREVGVCWDAGPVYCTVGGLCPWVMSLGL